MALSEQELVTNYEKYRELLLGTGEARKAQLEAMLDHFGDRLVLCPASSKREYHACYPGGLVEHSLRVLRTCRRMAKVSPEVYGGIPDESIVFAALLHDFGKIGNLDEDRYLPQTSDYWRERGNLYEINKRTPYCDVPHQSLFILQHFKIECNFDEWTAILLNDGQYLDSNRSWGMHERPLALLVHQADRLTCEIEKQEQNKNEQEDNEGNDT